MKPETLPLNYADIVIVHEGSETHIMYLLEKTPF